LGKNNKSREEKLNQMLPGKSDKKKGFNYSFKFGERLGKFFSGLLYVFIGGLVALGMPPFSFTAIFFLGILFLFHKIVKVENLKEVFRISFFFGVGFYSFGLHWVMNSFFVDQDTMARFGIFAPFALILFSMVIALFIAVPAVLTKKFGDKVWKQVIIFSVLWTLFEYIRGILFTGFPWQLAGHTWVHLDVVSDEAQPVLQMLSIFGVYGLSFLTIFLFASVYLLLPEKGKIREFRLKSLLVKKNYVFALSITLFAVSYLFGIVRIGEVEYHDDFKMRLVQPVIPQKRSYSDAEREYQFAKHLKFTDIMPLDDIDMVVWGETAVNVSWNEANEKKMAQVLPDDLVIVFGIPRVQYRPVYKFWNSLMVYDGAGNQLSVYDKNHLVPFGEYVPEAFSWLSDMSITDDSSFSFGESRDVISISDLPSFVPLICYEAIFPDQVIKGKRRPEFMLNISNDGWFGKMFGPYQHLTVSMLRAIEEGMPLVRVVKSGVTTVISPFGNMVEGDIYIPKTKHYFDEYDRADFVHYEKTYIPLNYEGFMDVSLPKKTTRTIYSFVGNYLINAICILILLVLVCPFKCVKIFKK
jgi:apolipoprotein N-acyltransferase